MSIDKILPYDPIFDDEGEDVPPDVKAIALRQSKELAIRVEQALNWVKKRELEYESIVAKYQPLIDDFMSEIKFHEDRYEYAKKVLTCLFPPGEDSTFCNDFVSAYYSPSYQIDTYDVECIPIEFQKVSTTPDKKAIREVLESGREVPGARMILNWNLKIGAGGKRGEHNKKQRENNRAKKQQTIEV